jgi:hypothetical protein
MIILTNDTTILNLGFLEIIPTIKFAISIILKILYMVDLVTILSFFERVSLRYPIEIRQTPLTKILMVII